MAPRRPGPSRQPLIKARQAALCDWLDEARPDVALLQEIKSVDENFPRELFEERGYNVETHGQKGFNGVAILSRLPMEDVGHRDFVGKGDARHVAGRLENYKLTVQIGG